MEGIIQKAISTLTGNEVDFVLFFDTDDCQIKVKYKSVDGDNKVHYMPFVTFRKIFRILG